MNAFWRLVMCKHNASVWGVHKHLCFSYTASKKLNFEHSLISQIRLKYYNQQTSTGKDANEYYKTRIGNIYTAKLKKSNGYFPTLEKNFINFSLWYDFPNLLICIFYHL